LPHEVALFLFFHVHTTATTFFQSHQSINQIHFPCGGKKDVMLHTTLLSVLQS
jgi:hypothetical protein